MSKILNTSTFDRTDSIAFQEEMVRLGMSGLSMKECGDYIGLDPDDWLEWCAEHPIAEMRHASGRARGIALAGQQLLKEIKSGKIQAITFYLKTQGQFVEKSAIRLEESVSLSHLPSPTVPTDPVEASKVYQQFMHEP